MKERYKEELKRISADKEKILHDIITGRDLFNLGQESLEILSLHEKQVSSSLEKLEEEQAIEQEEREEEDAIFDPSSFEAQNQ